jgi:predicted lipid-binding transport protein (Tim44 family)
MMRFMDILIYAAIAVVIFFWLFSILGRRTGNEKQRPTIFDLEPEIKSADVISLPLNSDQVDGEDAQNGIRDIQQADGNFNPQNFIMGAKYAFEKILLSFSKGNESELQPLLSADMYKAFKSVIDQRKAAGQTKETTLDTIKEVKIIEANLDNDKAVVTVRFISEQINVTYDSDRNVVEGDPDHYLQMTDIWTFERDIHSSNPNWQLVGTRSANAS